MAETTGERLRRLRGKRTLKEVSEATGLSQSAINMYEHGIRTPGDENKRKLAEYYQRSVPYIFFSGGTRTS